MVMGCLKLEHIGQKWTPLKVVHRALGSIEKGHVNRLVLKDHLGSVRVEFKDDGSGTAIPTNVTNYYPFGGAWESSAESDTRNNYDRLGGERIRSFDLDYYRHPFREYDPWIGRWTSPDMLSDWAPDWNPYRFGFNNPTTYIDPLGLFESRKEARKFRRDKDVSGRIRKADDGSFYIDGRRDQKGQQFAFGGTGTGFDGDESLTQRPIFRDQMRPYEPNFFEQFRDRNLATGAIFGIADNISITLQTLNPLDTRVQSLTGEFIVRNTDRQMALVNTTATFLPVARGTKAVASVAPSSSILPRLNTAQFSQMFKGSFVPRLAPALRGKLNRIFNFGSSQGNKLLNNGSAVLNSSKAAGATLVPESN